MVNYQNPYLNPYGFSSMPQPVQQTQVVRVNGENGARAYNLGANSSALLLDESGLIVWLVTTDGAGYKSVSAYDITPHQVKAAPDYSSLEHRIERLEEIINATADPAPARRRNDNPAPDPADDKRDTYIEQPKRYVEPTYSDEPRDETSRRYSIGVRK